MVSHSLKSFKNTWAPIDLRERLQAQVKKWTYVHIFNTYKYLHSKLHMWVDTLYLNCGFVYVTSFVFDNGSTQLSILAISLAKVSGGIRNHSSCSFFFISAYDVGGDFRTSRSSSSHNSSVGLRSMFWGGYSITLMDRSAYNWHK